MIEEKEMYYCSVSQTLKESNSSVKVARQSNKGLSLTPIYSKRLIEGNQHIILSDNKSMPFPVSEKKDANKRIKTVSTCDYNSILSSLRKFSEDKIDGRLIKRKGTECLEREEISSLTNTERISDFYQYTEESMRIISEMKIEVNKKVKTVRLPKNNKKLALFDLDETLVHCTGKVNKDDKLFDQSVEVTLLLGKKVKMVSM